MASRLRRYEFEFPSTGEQLLLAMALAQDERGVRGIESNDLFDTVRAPDRHPSLARWPSERRVKLALRTLRVQGLVTRSVRFPRSVSWSLTQEGWWVLGDSCLPIVAPVPVRHAA